MRILLSLTLLSLASCGFRDYKTYSHSPHPDDGQLHGIAPGKSKALNKPFGMVFIPTGTFHMGASDEDVNYNYSNCNRQVSISAFWMDATEITNNEYRQFVYWVRDSVTATKLGFIKWDKEDKGYVDWAKMKAFKWNDTRSIQQLSEANLLLKKDDQLFNKQEFDVSNLVYYSEVFDLKEAAKRKNANLPRQNFIMIKRTPIYPDTLVWIRDFAYSYNEPMTKRYFSHPAYGNYPVVGVNWYQAVAFCEWRTHLFNNYLASRKLPEEADFRLPTEAEWEYAARGGHSQSMFPWGNYYLRNKKGCLLANFKPGRGSYAEDGGFYTVRADAYWPNDFGLYCMAGNVAEWTSSLYTQSPYAFYHDMNPDVQYNARLADPPLMKRKVVRGGSWKDVGYYLQTGTRTYEYQDSSKSYIGFRCVIDQTNFKTK
jgi:gliding motility-associated lipoprotein GldK